MFEYTDGNWDKSEYFDFPSVKTADTSEELIAFYELHAKIVDSSKEMSEDAKRLTYYNLSLGHNTGVCDLFEEKLIVKKSVYKEVLELIDDEEAKEKLSGVMDFDEILIDQSHASMLSHATANAYEKSQDSEQREFLSEFSKLMQDIAYEKAIYIVGRNFE